MKFVIIKVLSSISYLLKCFKTFFAKIFKSCYTFFICSIKYIKKNSTCSFGNLALQYVYSCAMMLIITWESELATRASVRKYEKRVWKKYSLKRKRLIPPSPLESVCVCVWLNKINVVKKRKNKMSFLMFTFYMWSIMPCILN